MRHTTISTLMLCGALSLSAGALASAQVPSGGAGSDAKGNAPLKRAHTVNDGGARRGRNSFTEGQARQHILKAGYQSVTGLTKGPDGVWRGTAMKNGASVDVGMDFKGNVTEGGGAGVMAAQPAMMTGATTTDAAVAAPAPGATPPSAHRARHRRHHPASRCAHPGPDGTACSGVDRNRNSVSDREDRAIKAGARP